MRRSARSATCWRWGIPTEGAGIYNGSRTGGDIVLGWSGFLEAWEATLRNYYTHNIFWYADADVMCVRSPLTIEQARCWATLQGLTGQAMMASDRMMDLSEERVEMLRRVYPAVDIRPLDLYRPEGERIDKPVWDLKIGHLGRQYDVVAIFNVGTDAPMRHVLLWDRLGLEPERLYHVYDFWNREYLGAWETGMGEVAPTACRC